MSYRPIGMSGELQYENAARLVNLTPPNTVIGELIRNSIEAINHNDSKVIEFSVINYRGVRKLCITNNGVGMTVSQLEGMGDLSTKGEKGMSIQKNHGMGARLSGLSASPAGLIYHSSIGGNTYEIEMVKGDNEILIGDVKDITGEGFDFPEGVRVILVGDDDIADTVKTPWKGCGDSAIAREVTDRFFSWDDDVKIIAAKGILSRGGNRTLPNTLDVISGQEDHTVVVTDDGFKIHYSHITKDKHGIKKATGTNFKDRASGGVVFKGEVYSRKHKGNWLNAASSLGLTAVGDRVSVFIELPEGYPVENTLNRARAEYTGEGIHKKGDPLRILDFAAMVNDNKPVWLDRMIKEERDRTFSDQDKDLTAQMRQLITDYVPSRKGLVLSKSGDDKCGRGGKVVIKTKHGVKPDPIVDPNPNTINPDDGTSAIGDGDESAIEKENWISPPLVAIVRPGEKHWKDVGKHTVLAHGYVDGQVTESAIFVNGETQIIVDIIGRLEKLYSVTAKRKTSPSAISRVSQEIVDNKVKLIVMSAFIGAVGAGLTNESHPNDLRKSTNGKALASHIIHLYGHITEMLDGMKIAL